MGMFTVDNPIKHILQRLGVALVLVLHLGFVGRFRWITFEQSGATRYNFEAREWSRNMIVNLGKDAIMRRLGNLSGGGHVGGGLAEVGVSDNTATVLVTDSTLGGTNELWIVVPVANVFYIRPILYVSATFGYTQGNWTWNRLGIRDHNDVVWAMQKDATPLVKTSAKLAVLEWQIQIA